MPDLKPAEPAIPPIRTSATGAFPRHPVAGEDPQVARLSEMVVALLGELAIVTERLDTVERLLERRELVARADIESFVPAPPVQAERDAKRQRLVRKVFRPLWVAVERDAADAAKSVLRP